MKRAPKDKQGLRQVTNDPSRSILVLTCRSDYWPNTRSHGALNLPNVMTQNV